MITQERLKEVLSYAKETGTFVWTVQLAYRGKQGEVAGCKDLSGYIVIRIDTKLYLAHRLAFLYEEGSFPLYIDHINRDKADNRWCNLRKCTMAENLCNTAVASDNSSGVKGLSYSHKGFWRASIVHKGKQYNKQKKAPYSCEKTKALLTDWLQLKRQQLHGDFANHG